MLRLPTHLTEIEINPAYFGEKHYIWKTANLKLSKLKLKEYALHKNSPV